MHQFTLLIQLLHHLYSCTQTNIHDINVLIFSGFLKCSSSGTPPLRTCKTWKYAAFMSSELNMMSLSFGAGTWSSPMNDITRMCFFSSTACGQGISAFFILRTNKPTLQSSTIKIIKKTKCFHRHVGRFSLRICLCKNIHFLAVVSVEPDSNNVISPSSVQCLLLRSVTCTGCASLSPPTA